MIFFEDFRFFRFFFAGLNGAQRSIFTHFLFLILVFYYYFRFFRKKVRSQIKAGKNGHLCFIERRDLFCIFSEKIEFF